MKFFSVGGFVKTDNMAEFNFTPNVDIILAKNRILYTTVYSKEYFLGKLSGIDCFIVICKQSQQIFFEN